MTNETTISDVERKLAEKKYEITELKKEKKNDTTSLESVVAEVETSLHVIKKFMK